MGLLLRFPRLTAWLALVTLVGGMTVGAALGLHALAAAPASIQHAHGVIVALRGNDEFALAESGRRGVEWFRVAPGAHISIAHLVRHLRERAPTDVTYQSARSGLPLARTAD